MLINYFSPLLIIYYTRQKCHLSPKNKGFAISEITKHPTFMPFLPPLPHKCTSVCRKKINNYIHTRYLINYFLIHISSMKTCGRSGIVAECMLVPKEKGRRYCTKGNFSLSLQSITNWSCHRDGTCKSSRWCI